MLYNKDFLSKLDKYKHKNKYARITLLTNSEFPVETLEGRITSGSINIDGNSSIRRTCSLSMVSQDTDYNNYLWTMNSKFKLEVGLENHIDSRYPDIIWFPQGIYLFTSFAPSHTTNNFTISLQGKDKGCLLNGEVGGSFSSTIDLGTIEEIDGDISTITKLLLKDIIINMIHVYAGEPYKNIVVNDLDEIGLELMEYRYDYPMFLYRRTNSTVYDNVFFGNMLPDESVVKFYYDINCTQKVDFNNLKEGYLEDLTQTLHDTSELNPIYQKLQTTGKITAYYFTKIEYGQTPGYRETPLTYAGDLIANVGESISSILDKIVKQLGIYEYFYDIDGRFVFQKKQSFVNTFWTPTGDSGNKETKETALAYASTNIYTFNESELTSSFSNTPKVSDIKNDYSIWGTKKGVGDKKIDVHLRYAIDIKPEKYTTIEVDNNDSELAAYNKKYAAKLTGQQSKTYVAADTYSVSNDGTINCDWREIIYRMALDNFKYGTLDSFELKVRDKNPITCPFGMTGYEQYYMDLIGFWQDLYYPELVAQSIANNAIVQSANKLHSSDDYWNDSEKENFGWNKSIQLAPETLNFWFDFLDVNGDIAKYNTKKINTRSKVVKDDNIKGIYFRETPAVIFVKKQEESSYQGGYTYIQIGAVENIFTISAQGRSAKQELDELMYKHSYSVDSVSINAVPIYYLEPNSRIKIFDSRTKINGDYIISRISLPLAYNGTMSITATKAVENII